VCTPCPIVLPLFEAMLTGCGQDISSAPERWPTASWGSTHSPETGQTTSSHPPIENISITSRAELTRIEHMLGDLEVNAADRLLCESYAATAGCYSFRFDAVVSSRQDARLGAWHGSEIASVFRNFDGLGFSINPFSGKPDSFHYTSRIMGIAWASFIRKQRGKNAILEELPILLPRLENDVPSSRQASNNHLRRCHQGTRPGPPVVPADRLHTRMDGSPEGQFVTHPAVTLNDSLHDRHDNVKVVEDLAFPEVANQLAKVVGSVAVLGKLPIDDVELVATLTGRFPRRGRNEDTVFKSVIGSPMT